jgi:hypothetical protein
MEHFAEIQFSYTSVQKRFSRCFFKGLGYFFMTFCIKSKTPFLHKKVEFFSHQWACQKEVVSSPEPSLY